MITNLQDLEDDYYLAATLRDALDNARVSYNDDPAFEVLVRERVATARDRAFAAARDEARAVATAVPPAELARLAELLGRLAAIEDRNISSILVEDPGAPA